MSISSSLKFEGIIVKGTFSLSLDFPVNSLINGPGPVELEEAANIKFEINLFSSKKFKIQDILSPFIIYFFGLFCEIEKIKDS